MPVRQAIDIAPLIAELLKRRISLLGLKILQNLENLTESLKTLSEHRWENAITEPSYLNHPSGYQAHPSANPDAVPSSGASFAQTPV